MSEPNLLAYAALMLWPVVCLAAFGLLRPTAAAVVSILGGVLVLPVRVAFDLEGLPQLDKHSISCVSALAGCLIFAPRQLVRARPGTSFEMLAVLLLLAGFATVALNPEPVTFGPQELRGLTAWDGASMAADVTLSLWVPFLLGRALFRSSRDLVVLLSLLCVAALVYSLGVLYELRMSPQLHRQVYGFHQHTFAQVARFGGWRPMVFTPHGLSLSLFVLAAALAAAGLWRARLQPFRIPSGALALYLSALLVLVKSAAMIAYGLAVLPIAVLTRSRVQIGAALLGVAVVFVYPPTRALGIFPRDDVLQSATLIGEGRMRSLEVRFDNEDRLIERLAERPWFGWGGWGRNRVYDAATGEDQTITDGYWIITMGTRGAVGFAGAFAMLLGPVALAYRHRRRFGGPRDRVLVSSTALIVTVMGVDLLPNGHINPFTVLVSGALAGIVEGLGSPGTERRSGG